jgi:hypothetical protein
MKLTTIEVKTRLVVTHDDSLDPEVAADYAVRELSGLVKVTPEDVDEYVGDVNATEDETPDFIEAVVGGREALMAATFGPTTTTAQVIVSEDAVTLDNLDDERR